MTIPLTGTGGLFTRWGKILKLVSDINAFRGTTLVTDSDNLYSQYPTGTADEGLIDGLDPAVAACQNSSASYLSFLTSVAQSTLTQMVNDDQALPSQNDIQSALTYLINQMTANGQSVLAMNVGIASVANSGNHGNGILVSTSLGATGHANEDQVPEKIVVNVTSDSSSNSSLAGNENFQAQGQYSVSSLNWNYPVGSAGTTFFSAINAGQSNAQGTKLTNGDFENFTVANTPDNWTIAVGSAGTQVKESTSQFYTGVASLNLVGDGSTLTELDQTFNSSTGTLGTLSARTLYAVNGWVKMDATPAAGVLSLALIDGSGNVVNDDQGNANNVTLSLPTLGTTWTNLKGVFRTPYILASTLKLRLKLTTALTNGRNLYIDRLGLGQMFPLYAGGPSFAVFSGSGNFYIPDGFVATATNSYGASGSQSSFQWGLDRLLNMKQYNLLFPSAASGFQTISDALIS